MGVAPGQAVQLVQACIPVEVDGKIEYRQVQILAPSTMDAAGVLGGLQGAGALPLLPPSAAQDNWRSGFGGMQPEPPMQQSIMVGGGGGSQYGGYGSRDDRQGGYGSRDDRQGGYGSRDGGQGSGYGNRDGGSQGGYGNRDSSQGPKRNYSGDRDNYGAAKRQRPQGQSPFGPMVRAGGQPDSGPMGQPKLGASLEPASEHEVLRVRMLVGEQMRAIKGMLVERNEQLVADVHGFPLSRSVSVLDMCLLPGSGAYS